MWSNDFPHGDSTWPKSRQVVAHDRGDLPTPLRAKLVRERRPTLQHSGSQSGSVIGDNYRNVAYTLWAE
jgi:hypothetical protein